MPLWTVVFGRLLVGERITRARLVALGLGLGRMAALVAPEARTLWAAPAGTLLMLGAAVAWAIGTVLTKAIAGRSRRPSLTGWQLVLGAVPIVLGAVVRHASSGDAGLLFSAGLPSLRPFSARPTRRWSE